MLDTAAPNLGFVVIECGSKSDRDALLRAGVRVRLKRSATIEGGLNIHTVELSEIGVESDRVVLVVLEAKSARDLKALLEAGLVCLPRERLELEHDVELTVSFNRELFDGAQPAEAPVEWRWES